MRSVAITVGSLACAALIGACGGELRSTPHEPDASVTLLDPSTCFAGVESAAPVGPCTNLGTAASPCGSSSSLAFAETVMCQSVGGEKRRPDRPGCREATSGAVPTATDQTSYICDPIACIATEDASCEGRAFRCPTDAETSHVASGHECTARGALLCCPGY